MTASRAELVGVRRVLEPPGALPQAAERLDADSPADESELELDVELLNLDSSSHRQLVDAHGGDGERVAAAIAEIVAARGKLHNPVTGSGGICVGTVRRVGTRFPGGGEVRVGDRLATLASLTLTPLRLERVGPVDPHSPQVPAAGRAIVAAAAPWARVPDDLPLALVLAALDVYGAASHTRTLARPGGRVTVLGAGRAGLLAAAAARDAVGTDGTVVVCDRDEAAVARALRTGACTLALTLDASDALASAAELERRGVEPADLTVVVVNRPHCELAAVLATRDGGDVLFFSMATSFTAVALGAEGVASQARLLVGSGYAPDRGSYALELLRRDARLRDALAELL